MVKKIINKNALCVKCQQYLIECNSLYFCDNIDCSRFGLLSNVFLDVKKIKKEVKK